MSESEEDKCQSTAAVEQLLGNLGKGDHDQLGESLEKLGINRDSEMFLSACEMTRKLNDSLRNFCLNLSSKSVTMHSTSIPDAAAKLEEVIQLTFEATETTLESIDKQTDLLIASKESLKKGIEKIEKDPEIADETKEYLTQLLTSARERIGESLKTNMDVVTAQEYQDLTGQALKKVIKLVTDIEENLIGIVQLFGLNHPDGENDNQEAAQPRLESDGKIDQDLADSMLKEFES